jgi:hypothetical protein
MTSVLLNRSKPVPSHEMPRQAPVERDAIPLSQSGEFVVSHVLGIASQSSTVMLWCVSLACSVVLFAVWPPTAALVVQDPVSVAFKFGFGGLQAGFAFLLFFENLVLATRPFFVLAALALSLIGLLSFAYVQLLEPGETGYSAALFSMLVCAIPALIPPRAISVDTEQLARSVLRLLTLASVFQVVWQVVGSDGGLGEEVSHERTYVLVFFLLAAGFERRLSLGALAMLLIVVSLYLRPSSTLAGATVMALFGLSLRWLSFSRLLRVMPQLIACTLLVQNLVFALDPAIPEAVLAFETDFKEKQLDSISDTSAQSNSDFRLAIFRAVHDDISSRSFLLGKAFTGDVNINVSSYYRAPRFGGIVEIHSDFLILLSQGGLIGYGLFSILFLGIVRLGLWSAELAKAAGAERGEALLRAIPWMICVFGFYISYNPLMAKVEYVLFFLILAPISTFMARQLAIDKHAQRPPVLE